jgi:hypothetical protein
MLTGMRRIGVLLSVVTIAGMLVGPGPGGTAPARAPHDRCGFDEYHRLITHRRHITCRSAKRVLRALKAGRRAGTVPTR